MIDLFKIHQQWYLAAADFMRRPVQMKYASKAAHAPRVE
jgi:hypothetical protein